MLISRPLRFLIRTILILSTYLLVCALGYLGFLTYRSNLVGLYLLLTALAYGLGGPYLLWSHLKKEHTVRQEDQNRSFWLIIPGFIVVYYASPLEYLYVREVIPRTIWMQVLGLGLLALSLALFVWARRAIKGMYSGRLRVIADHILVQSGPYRLIRHPAYFGYILMSLGITIGYSSLLGLLAIPLLLIPALIYRMNVEEELLIAEFGNQYSDYSKRTKRLLPGIW